MAAVLNKIKSFLFKVPAGGTDGQALVYDSGQVGGLSWATGLGGSLVDIQVFTTTGVGTWTKPAGLGTSSFIIAEVQAAGGGSADITAGSGQMAMALGGGGGAYARGKILASDLGATETLSVGAGGPANSATNGGDSYFGAVGHRIQTEGGKADLGIMAAGTTVEVIGMGAVGAYEAFGGSIVTYGTGWTELLTKRGGDATPAVRLSATQGIISRGGTSFLGGTLEYGGISSTSSVGGGAGFRGSGASGAAAINATVAGRKGGDGIIIVYTYA